MKSPKEQWLELQEQNLQLLKSQQEAYLAGIKAWRAQLDAATKGGTSTPQVPSFPAFTGQAGGFGQNPAGLNTAFPAFPTTEEITEVNRAYMQKIAEQQQEFLRRLTELNSDQS